MQCRHCEIYFSPEKSKQRNHDDCCNSVTSKFHHSQSSKEAHGDENKYAEGDGDGDIGEYVGEDDGEDDAEDGDGDDDGGDEADGDEWKDCCADHEVLASVARPPTPSTSC